jgi:capsular polysaccharide biosynthesis protein
MNDENRSDEINLRDLFNVLRRYKRLLIGLPILGVALSTLLVYFVLQPTWEASAVLEIGNAAQVQGQGLVQVLVEPVSNVLARVMLPSFAKGAINHVNIKAEELPYAKRFYGTLKASQVKGTELIEIKLRGPSAEMAGNLINGAIVNLQRMHTEMMAESIEKNKRNLQILTADIQKFSSETDLIRKQLLASPKWSAFDATLLSATILKDKYLERRDMIQRRIIMEEQINPARIINTRLVGEVYVSEGPVFPNKQMIIGIAMLLGLFVAVVFAFAHNAITSKT